MSHCTERKCFMSKKKRQTVFFTPLDPFGDKTRRRTSQRRFLEAEQRNTITASEKLLWTPSSEHRAKDYDSGRQSLMPKLKTILCRADCIHEMISQKKRERTLFQRLSTPRPSPKIVLKSSCQTQQQQQQQCTSQSASSRTRKQVRKVEREQKRGSRRPVRRPRDIPHQETGCARRVNC